MTRHRSPVLRRLSAPLVTLFAAALALVYAQACFACSCIQQTFAEAAAGSEVVFVGTVTGTQARGAFGSGSVDLTFEVSDVRKGEASALTVVRTPDNSAACGFNFEQGRTYVVMAGDVEGILETTLCSGTALHSDVADGDLAALGEGYAPLAGAADAPTAAVTTAPRNPAAWYGFGGLGAVALALGAVIWWPRRDG